jgi:hypothetical protein
MSNVTVSGDKEVHFSMDARIDLPSTTALYASVLSPILTDSVKEPSMRRVTSVDPRMRIGQQSKCAIMELWRSCGGSIGAIAFAGKDESANMEIT